MMIQRSLQAYSNFQSYTEYHINFPVFPMLIHWILDISAQIYLSLFMANTDLLIPHFH